MMNVGVVSDDGSGGSDTITGTVDGIITGDGDDSIVGGAGDEFFVLSAGTDTLNGGAGFDLLDYGFLGASSGVTVDMASNWAYGTWNGAAFDHDISEIEHIREKNAMFFC